MPLGPHDVRDELLGATGRGERRATPQDAAGLAAPGAGPGEATPSSFGPSLGVRGPSPSQLPKQTKTVTTGPARDNRPRARPAARPSVCPSVRTPAWLQLHSRSAAGGGARTDALPGRRDPDDWTQTRSRVRGSAGPSSRAGPFPGNSLFRGKGRTRS